jgi:Astacin (Peptidase family M12A)
VKPKKGHSTMTDKVLKVCYIKRAPHPDDEPEVATAPSAQERAVLERVDNVRVTPDVARSHYGVTRAAIAITSMWENGKTLRVKFLDGEPVVQQKVEAIAHEWEQYANLTLQFVTSGEAEIRVSFKEQGFSWSEVGTDSGPSTRTKPSMNFGWLHANTATTEYRRVVLHEFGHALGLIHEHQNPAAAGLIPWDKPKVYDYYARQGWKKADVDSNIFEVYAVDATNFTTFDPTSIMEYAVPDELTIGSYAIGWNTELSQTDKDFMAQKYPKGSPGLVELTVGGPPATADLAVAGEVDTFHFNATTAASYTIATTGTTDTVMTLQGPSDRAAVLAWDDDRGRGTNAKITRRLQPGEYWVTVRHKTPVGIGTYGVKLTSRG